MKLMINALIKFGVGSGFTAALLFFSAGTLHWMNGWIFMSVLFIPMFCAGIVMMVKNPELLRRRLDAKEKQMEQKTVVMLSGIMFIAGFLLAGFNYRFEWLLLPSWITWGATAIFLFAYALYGEVLRENAFLSRTIQVQKGQTVVDTGLYGIVRHPMYVVTILLFLSMPLILGWIWSLLIFLTYPLIITKRIRNEEKVLKEELEGYEAYCKKVRYRLIPGIW